MEPKDVVHVLGNMIRAVRPGGTALDLQVIRPDPSVQAGERLLCKIDGEALFRQADAATAAVDALVIDGTLAEEAVDDHDVLVHYPTGADLVDDFKDKERRLPPDAIPALLEITQPCVVRERCRLRKLTVAGRPPGGDGLCP